MHIQNCSELRKLDGFWCNELASHAVIVDLEKDSTLWRAAEPADYVYLQTRGMCMFRLIGIEGTEAFSGVSVKGNILGETEVLAHSSRPNEALVLEPSSFLRFPATVFRQAIVECPEFARDMLRMIAEKYIHMMEVFYGSRVGTVEERLARIVFMIVIRSRLSLEQGLLIPHKLTQETLARISGISRPPVQQVLKKWKKEGIADASYGKFTILNPDYFKHAN